MFKKLVIECVLLSDVALQRNHQQRIRQDRIIDWEEQRWSKHLWRQLDSPITIKEAIWHSESSLNRHDSQCCNQVAPRWVTTKDNSFRGNAKLFLGVIYQPVVDLPAVVQLVGEVVLGSESVVDAYYWNLEVISPGTSITLMAVTAHRNKTATMDVNYQFFVFLQWLLVNRATSLKVYHILSPHLTSLKVKRQLSWW